jgi:hypothetical protein
MPLQSRSVNRGFTELIPQGILTAALYGGSHYLSGILLKEVINPNFLQQIYNVVPGLNLEYVQMFCAYFISRGGTEAFLDAGMISTNLGEFFKEIFLDGTIGGTLLVLYEALTRGSDPVETQLLGIRPGYTPGYAYTPGFDPVQFVKTFLVNGTVEVVANGRALFSSIRDRYA